MIAKIMNRVDFGGIVNYTNNDKSQTKRANLLAHEGVCITDNKCLLLTAFMFKLPCVQIARKQ